MLAESQLLTPEWLAALVSGQCVIIRGHVPERVLESLKVLLPRGVLVPTSLDVPAGDLTADFFATIMPAAIGDVPRRVYFLPTVGEENVPSLVSLKASCVCMQWVAVVPDPAAEKPIMPGVLLFDAKLGSFLDAECIPPAALAWAREVIGNKCSAEDVAKQVALEGPKILAAANAVAQGEYGAIASSLGKINLAYIESIFGFACDLVGAEGVSPAEAARAVTEAAVMGSKRPTSPRPQIFAGGKAVALRTSGEPVQFFVAEMDAIKRDPEMYASLLAYLKAVTCDDCGLTCRAPEQKWDCLRKNSWASGVPSAIADGWLDVFANLVRQTGRDPKEAFLTFSAVLAKVPGSRLTSDLAAFARLVEEGNASKFSTPASLRAVPSPSVPPQPHNAEVPPAGRSTAFLGPRERQILARLDNMVGRLVRISEVVVDRLSRSILPQSPSLEEKLD
jgi:hypothetical protein